MEPQVSTATMSPSVVPSRPAPRPVGIELDSRGPWPTLRARKADDTTVWLHAYQPHDEADQWLHVTLRDADPPVIVVIGLGLGYVLDALERRGSRATVLAFEPFADSLPHFHARRDWSGWIDTGRLHIVAGADGDGAQAWAAIDPEVMPPVLVNPALARTFSSLVASCRMALTRARFGSRLDLQKVEVKQSMLHPAVLTAIEHFAAGATGPIVEVGAYVGGATIAMARGVRDAGRTTPILTIEPGGTHLAHPELPSADIYADLEHNLTVRGLDTFVQLHRGLSTDAAVLDRVRQTVAAHGAIGLLCIDADGMVQRDFDHYLPWCGEGCVLVVDDYAVTGLHEKGLSTQQAVQQLIDGGKAFSRGVHGYGTWMGLYHP